MTPPDVVDISRDAVIVLLQVSGPIMLIGLGIGLVIAFIQALTQIQEMTLTFVPKILAVFVSIILFMPFMISSMTAFWERILQRVIAPVG
jgi:flagellar biosynthetic protein FliQ